MIAPAPPVRSCGSCTLCCKVMGIVELDKPAGRWCDHCKPGQGCAAYAARPASCRTFNCGWVSDPDMPEAMRPDRCKVVLSFTNDGARLIAQCDPGHPTAWRREPMYGQLKRWAAIAWDQGRTVTVLAGERLWVLTRNHEVDLGVVDPEAGIAVAERPGGGVDMKIVPKSAS